VQQIHEVLRVGFKPGTYGLDVLHANHSATLPSVVVVVFLTDFVLAIRSRKSLKTLLTVSERIKIA